jgi:hypothetical protein
MLHNQNNYDKINQYIANFYAGVYSIPSLEAAVAAIPDLERTPTKSAAELNDAFEAKELARRLREATENRVDFKENAKKIVDAQEAKKEADTRQKTAALAIESAPQGISPQAGRSQLEDG